jgi:hypothetical protein
MGDKGILPEQEGVRRMSADELKTRKNRTRAGSFMKIPHQSGNRKGRLNHKLGMRTCFDMTREIHCGC